MNNKVTSRAVYIVLVVSMIVALTGCASSFPYGGIYTELQLPAEATSNVISSPKVGTAECKSYLSMVAIGDCSIEKARKDANITKINYVDWDARNILGIYGEYKVTVYGD